jgi:hypothetical protein
MARGGEIIHDLFAELESRVQPGVNTLELDAWAEAFIRSHDGAVPLFKGQYGFPGSLCTSINDEVVHGIPSARPGPGGGRHRLGGRGRSARRLVRRFGPDLCRGRSRRGSAAASRRDAGRPGRRSLPRWPGSAWVTSGRRWRKPCGDRGSTSSGTWWATGSGGSCTRSPRSPTGGGGRVPSAGRDGSGHRADDRHRERGASARWMMVDDGHGRRLPLGAFRAHGGHDGRRVRGS